MASSRPIGVNRPRRRWSFADCIFDEANWTLIVSGRRVPVEAKPLELLRELLLRPGDLITKDELLDAVWPDVVVVEASLPTAIAKLRRALRDDRRKVPIIETVPRVGYRLGVPAAAEDSQAPLSKPTPADPSAVSARPDVSGPITPAPSLWERRGQLTKFVPISAGLALMLVALVTVFTPSQNVSATKATEPFTHQAAANALRRLDVPAIERMIVSGWDPSTPWDKEGNDAFTMLLNRCEWDPAHDRRKMLLMARTLIEAGVQIDRRNVWGDTPYSIAKAPRYCGPDHPVTQMLEAMCYGGSMGPKDLCLATYELTAEQRRAQGLPPKG